MFFSRNKTAAALSGAANVAVRRRVIDFSTCKSARLLRYSLRRSNALAYPRASFSSCYLAGRRSSALASGWRRLTIRSIRTRRKALSCFGAGGELAFAGQQAGRRRHHRRAAGLLFDLQAACGCGRRVYAPPLRALRVRAGMRLRACGRLRCAVMPALHEYRCGATYGNTHANNNV